MFIIEWFDFVTPVFHFWLMQKLTSSKMFKYNVLFKLAYLTYLFLSWFISIKEVPNTILFICCRNIFVTNIFTIKKICKKKTFLKCAYYTKRCKVTPIFKMSTDFLDTRYVRLTGKLIHIPYSSGQIAFQLLTYKLHSKNQTELLGFSNFSKKVNE